MEKIGCICLSCGQIIEVEIKDGQIKRCYHYPPLQWLSNKLYCPGSGEEVKKEVKKDEKN
ncbi:MAG: hypothetical protein V1910_00070 [bacterium]